MAFKFYDRVRVAVASAPGTGNVALGAATSAFQSFSAAGASNGDTFPYLIVDGNNWEIGVGTYSTTGPTVTRTTITASSNAGSAVNFTSSAIVMCAIRAEDVGAGTLAGDSDVSISSPTNGQVLTYSTSAGKWENANASGGGAGGTPPTVVQFDSASVNSTAPSVTMGTAPVNGNLLVAFVFGSSSTPTANTGWTLQTAFSQGSGFWYFYMFTKVAGAGESTTQSPVTAGSSGYWTVGIYEIDGQNATTPVLLTASQYAANNVYATTPVFPGFENTLALFAGVPSTGQTYTVTNVLGCAVVDANLTTAAGAHAAFGHTDSNSPLYNMTLTYSASVPSDIGMIVITH